MSKIKHELKTIQPYFDAVWNGDKTFEVRVNDRNYKVGDIILLKEYEPIKGVYSDRCILVVITYILANFYAVQDGYIVFSFSILRRHKGINYTEIDIDADFILRSFLKFFIANPEIESISVLCCIRRVTLDRIIPIDNASNLANRYNIDSLDSKEICTAISNLLEDLICLERRKSIDHYTLLFSDIEAKLSKYIKVSSVVGDVLTPICSNLERTLLEIEASNVKR